MGRNRTHAPNAATTVKSYIQLEELVRTFVTGPIHLLAIVGNPGLSKSQSIKAAIGTTPCLHVRGRKSALHLYCDLYQHQDQPVVIDDADDLIPRVRAADWGGPGHFLSPTERHRTIPACFSS